MSHTNYFDFYSISDLGLVRVINEDCVASKSHGESHLFVVCDGMGGYNGGDVASNIAVNSLIEFFDQNVFDDYKVFFDKAIQYVQTKILEGQKSNIQFSSMGSTLVAIVIKEQKVYYAHVGDSRLYLRRKNKLLQLTKDHSYVQALIDEKIISKEEAETHPRKHLLLSALGVELQFTYTICKKPLIPQNNDLLMLCTDGLMSTLSNLQICTLMGGNGSLEQITQALLEGAHSEGAPDNTSIIMIKFHSLKETKGLVHRILSQIFLA